MKIRYFMLQRPPTAADEPDPRLGPGPAQLQSQPGPKAKLQSEPAQPPAGKAQVASASCRKLPAPSVKAEHSHEHAGTGDLAVGPVREDGRAAALSKRRPSSARQVQAAAAARPASVGREPLQGKQAGTPISSAARKPAASVDQDQAKLNNGAAAVKPAGGARQGRAPKRRVRPWCQAGTGEAIFLLEPSLNTGLHTSRPNVTFPVNDLISQMPMLSLPAGFLCKHQHPLQIAHEPFARDIMTLVRSCWSSTSLLLCWLLSRGWMAHTLMRAGPSQQSLTPRLMSLKRQPVASLGHPRAVLSTKQLSPHQAAQRSSPLLANASVPLTRPHSAATRRAA